MILNKSFKKVIASHQNLQFFLWYFTFILFYIIHPPFVISSCVADVTIIYLLTTLKMFMSHPLNPGIRYLTTYLTSKHTCILIILIASNICVVSHLLHLSKWQVLFTFVVKHISNKTLGVTLNSSLPAIHYIQYVNILITLYSEYIQNQTTSQYGLHPHVSGPSHHNFSPCFPR